VRLMRLLHRWLLELGVEHDEVNDDFTVLFGFSHAGAGRLWQRKPAWDRLAW